jgi:HlyD family secretion protein
MRKIFFILILLALIACGIWAYFHFQGLKDNQQITLFGNVDVRQVDIAFRVPGRVVSLLYEEGNFVKQGALMSVLEKQPYADQVAQAQAVVKSSKFSFNNAEILLKRRLELKGDGGVSQEDYDNALTSKNVALANFQAAQAGLGVAEKNLVDTEVFCPTDGIILTRIREPGTVVGAGDPVCTLSIMSPVWIRAFVSEPYLGFVHFGMPAQVFTDTPGGKVYQGHVGFISPLAEFTPKTVETTQLRTDLVYRLRIYVDNPDWGLRQGMPVTVKLRRALPGDERK